jgi:hypothetical protein
MSVTYDEQGEPCFLGFRVEEWYGSEWVRAVAGKQKMTREQASDLLEHGGPNGVPLPFGEATRLTGWPTSRGHTESGTR